MSPPIGLLWLVPKQADPPGSLVTEGYRSKVASRRLGASGFVGLFLRDQSADALGQKRPVKRLLERIVEA
jgi:hypothetical protein